MRVKRTILIVEDDKDMNEQLKALSLHALMELTAENLPIEGTIHHAFSYQEASHMLAEWTGEIDFLSLDLALTPEEEELVREGMKPGGLILLSDLQMAARQPATVVVTGERRSSYAPEAWQQGILAYYQKDRFDIYQYIQAVKAAMWYWETAERINKLTAQATAEQITAATASWQAAQAAAVLAGNPHWPQLAALEQKLAIHHSTTTSFLPGGAATL